MPIQLIIASPEPRFHDFVREQLAGMPNAEALSGHEDMGPNLSARILHDLNVHPQSAVLLDVSSDPEQGLRALEQLRQAVPALYVILSGFQSSEEFLLRSMRLGGADFLQQPLKRAEFSEALVRLEEHVQRIDRLDQAMLEGIMARDPLGFSVLCAPEELERSRMIEEQHLREIGGFLIEHFDVVVVDGSRALDGLLLSCLELSESIFVVLTPEFPAVRNAQQYLGAMARAGYGLEAVKLVVNRHEKRGSLHVSLDQLKQTLGAAPFWVLPNRYQEAMQAVHEARPVVIRGSTELGRSYRDFAKKMGLNGQPAAAGGKKSER